MTNSPALVAVNREKQATAKLVAHKPLPFGIDTRPLHIERSTELLTSPSEWTKSLPSFLFRHIAQRDGGACFTQLKQLAEQEYVADHPDEWSFPVFRLAEFLEAGYRSGLLAKNFTSPKGDIYSPQRVVMYEITSDAQALLAHHAPADIEKKADKTPSISDSDTSHAQEDLAPVLDYLKAHGPSVRDTMLDKLTQAASDDAVQSVWERLEDLIDEGVTLGLLLQEEDRLGAYIVSLSRAANDSTR
jgi:hypothetical protein